MPEKSYPSRTADQFVVRLPGGMRDLISETAKAASRSMNAEIVARLQQSLEAKQSAEELHREIEAQQVALDGYRAAVLSANFTVTMLIDRIKALATELPKSNPVARQCLALVQALEKGDNTLLAAVQRQLFADVPEALAGIDKFEADLKRKRDAAVHGVSSKPVRK